MLVDKSQLEKDKMCIYTTQTDCPRFYSDSYMRTVQNKG